MLANGIQHMCECEWQQVNLILQDSSHYSDQS